ncbi:MAG: allene oxide cyclase family protein [Actinomycetota bacterium]
MLRKILAGAACAGLGVVLGVATFSSAAPGGGRTVHVIEHANTDAVIDTGEEGDTSGDLLTFHNPVYDASNKTKVGHDQGECTRISPEAGTWECRWVTYLKGGHITVEGPFNDTHDTSLAITGGTGAYRNAAGEMALKSRNGGTQFDFVYELSP